MDLPAIALVALPNAASLSTLAIVGRSRAAACPPVPMQPPGYVFALVWPILYALLGGSMATLYVQGHSRAYLVAPGLLVIALNAWYARNGVACRPLEGLISMVGVVTLSVVVAAVVATRSVVAAAMLVPLVAWLCFACALTWQTALAWQTRPARRLPGPSGPDLRV